MKAKLFLSLIVILFISPSYAQNKKEIGYGIIDDGFYKNDYFGMSIAVPSDWSVQSQAQLKEIAELGAEVIAGEDPNLRAILKASEKQTVNLFAFFKYEQGTPVDFNPSLMALAERVTNAPGIKRGSDYLFHVKKYLETSQLVIDFSKENYTEQLSNISFDVMPTVMDINGFKVLQNYYAARFDDYVLSFITTYSNEGELKELNSHLNKLTFRD